MSTPNDSPADDVFDDGAQLVAVIGMAGRFPGAPDLEAYWELIASGREGTTRFDAATLRRAGVPDALIADPAFVPVRGVIEDADAFDAACFRMSPREAELTDPQHRLFLETCAAAMEAAGVVSTPDGPRVGVYAGCSTDTYLTEVLLRDRALLDSLGGMQAVVGNDKDHLATRVAYKLDLRGPALTVQTACSTSLVAIQLAWQALTTWQCDIALAGGASVTVPMIDGHRPQEGGIVSHDGHTRTFDARATGAVGGDGVGVVVLKRLDDALADGDPIRAVLRAVATNNDGAAKVGYTAPGVTGQAAVIADALLVAGVEVESIGYVEAHGTATPLGDPIEVRALTRAFREHTQRRAFCALGSAKSAIGHLNAAAGVASFIKTVLALEHATLPPVVGFETPNPQLELDTSPFRVPRVAEPWRAEGGPRRAGVSSFGVGGTNAHAILEEAPPEARPVADDEPDRPRLLMLSARSEPSLDALADKLAGWVDGHPETSFAALTATLAARRPFAHRRAWVASSLGEARQQLAGPPAAAGVARQEQPSRIALLFPGQGSQRPGMGDGLYRGDPRFRGHIDRVAELFEPLIGRDLRQLLYPAPEALAEATELLEDQLHAGPVLFAISYACAMLWIDRGVAPDLLLGQSTGEYVAAAIGGVLELEDAARLFTARARLMDSVPRGSVLHVALPPDELTPLLADGTWLALVNGPRACVVTGLPEPVAELAARLEAREVPNRRVRVSVPAHSPLLAPIADALAAEARTVRLSPPRIPMISGTTGRPLTDAEATDPDYWVRHLLEPVALARAMETLGQDEGVVLVEAGPHRSMSALASYNLPGHAVLASLPAEDDPAARDPELAARHELSGLAALWVAGAALPAEALVGPGAPRRVALPPTPFERTRYWPEARDAATATRSAASAASAATVAPRRHPRPAISTPHVPPRTDAERLVAEIVSDLLGIDGVGAEDDFFSLGGSSLITLQLIQQIKSRLGADLPPAAAFQGLDVARMAAFLDDTRITPASGVRAAGPSSRLGPNIVPIRPEGSLPPLFFAHPAAGIVFPYFELARRLGPDQPFYGLQAAGLDGDEEPDARVEEMAARYLPQIRAIQPEGPYYLGGYSFGCYVAYEMAMRLQAAGAEVALLALVDEGAPVDGHRPTVSEISRLWLGSAGRSFLGHLRDYLYLRSRQGGGDPSEPRRSAARKLLGGRRAGLRQTTLRAMLERSAMAALLPTDAHATALGQPAMRPLFELLLLHLKETFRYAPPGGFRGPATLFKSDWSVERPFWERVDSDPTLGWARLIASPISIRRISGDHLAVLRVPHVARLVEELVQALAEAREAPPG
ncbi:MAG: acyltransferase domain-containing protein [Deltaproteobacteria bacterium]|nr:acyltransferase domain-containing protein [Deltaproteobacteria bacterium]MCB9787035.1 acyltransferase domain-containing protein [Deltaproteobacteria bacterium]